MAKMSNKIFVVKIGFEESQFYLYQGKSRKRGLSMASYGRSAILNQIRHEDDDWTPPAPPAPTPIKKAKAAAVPKTASPPRSDHKFTELSVGLSIGQVQKPYFKPDFMSANDAESHDGDVTLSFDSTKVSSLALFESIIKSERQRLSPF